MPARRRNAAKTIPKSATYTHPSADSPMRPEVGTQAQFRKKKPPATYKYDSSLSPALDWDGQNPAREQGEALIRRILDATTIEEAHNAAEQLQRISRPFLNWAGKAERLSFDVPTLPLFVHERLSTKAILETVTGHRRDEQQELELFADPRHSITDQVLRAYEHRDRWVNRMILGDSLVVMNSLLHYEGLGAQVQMIYIDPPYGVKFGSNFQPFVRKRDVEHNNDEDMTREPEMVQAYRDTWEVGLHSYLTYLRDRLHLARELLSDTGSVFVQINDENAHHVRALLDDVFGAENCVVTIVLKKKSSTETTEAVNDVLLWYARQRSSVKVQPLAQRRRRPEDDPKFNSLVDKSGNVVRATDLDEDDIEKLLSEGYEFARVNYPLVSQDPSPTRSGDFVWRGKAFKCGPNKHWRYDLAPGKGMNRLADADRLFDGGGASLGGIVRWSDWPYVYLSNVWTDIHGEKYPVYVVQTARRALERCVLMTTDPGDLVLDPTCGSGTTAYVAEQWGRRWITIDTSRVPLALARQRLLTATYPWYELKDDGRGPSGGFIYRRKQNSKGEEVGGIVPHITLKSIANDEPPAEEVLVDRPETKSGVTRVSGPFVFEATIPTPIDWEGDGAEDSGIPRISEAHGSFVERMLEVLRRSPVLHLGGNRSVALRNVRPPSKSLALSAEAIVDAGATGRTPASSEAIPGNGDKRDKTAGNPVAIVFGPESGAVSEKLVYEAAREATAKRYTHLFVIGFSIQPNARELIEKSDEVMGIPATYVQATPDVLMGDLLKNMRSSQIFSVCGLPEIDIIKRKAAAKGEPERYQVSLLGLDVFDPVTMELDHRKGDDVPAWFLDTDYNGLCFHVDQAFFPRTSAWDNLKRALKSTYDDTLWDHLAGTTSAPFTAGQHRTVAAKVIDDRGNELLVVKALS